ncbi:MAG: phosphoglycerate dehydrogenase [Caldilineaceae bacterium]|nr:phosphoglycerate dehydrogenase [Caldilineaceae bacterium]MBP8107445.1 phosphoglycerate dehydrogenase [Caldilineaceae bacterium]MBP8122406.1 phosphoglycerate dehydrogenase [Caldilineaceae bacterium]MBP9074491.1 phosphoglycerate dehydrogenase [Caldilineaceae bacterium]
MTTRFKVLVADDLSEAGLAPLLAEVAIQVDQQTNISAAELLTVIGDYDALLVRSRTKVTADVFQAGKKLRVVGRAGVGVDNIDIPAATQSGVIIVNAPTGNVVAAAEHTIAMLMALARMIPQADAHIRAGLWKRNQFVGVEVRDKVLGVVGLGRIAQEVVSRAQGLGMAIFAYDPYVTKEYADQRGVTLLPLDEVLANADFLTVHVPLTPETKGLIGTKALATMKQGARLLNVARGGIINEVALVAAIESGHIAGAAIDVYEEEPLPGDNVLRSRPEIILTPHLGGSTVEAQEKVAVDVAIQVVDVLMDRPARYAVNAPIIPPKDLDFLVPYIDLTERMGRLLRQLEDQGISRVELTAHGRLADFDLAYVRSAAIKGLLAGVVEERVNLVNANLLAERRGMNLMERRQRQHEHPYESMVTLRASSGERRWTVRGALLKGVATIVDINDMWVDFPAEGHMLLTSHTDKPGIIGRVGMILGQGDINISFMHVGRRGPRQEAIMVLGTDEPVPDAMQMMIRQVDDVYWMKSISI